MSSELASRVLGGDRTAVAKAITECERGVQSELLHDLISELWPHTGGALTIGVTGPPGVGKSTLIDALATVALTEKKKVAVVGVDPVSESSGGALLADRLRMERASKFADFTMRSMTSGGDRGGLAFAAPLASLVYDAAGNDVVIIESVGVGQTETDVAHVAQLTILVHQEEMGDWAQAAKGGIMEIPDIICVNKVPSDQQSRVVSAKLQNVHTARLKEAPSVVAIEAITGDGVAGLWRLIQDKFNLQTPEQLVSQRINAFTWWAGQMAVAEVAKRAKLTVHGTDMDTSLNPIEMLEFYRTKLK